MTTLLTVRAPLPPGAWTRRPAERLPWPLIHPGARIYARARHGIFHGVRALGLGTGDEVLVPAYHHGSEVEAFVRAGIVARFFAGTAQLEPDPGELESLLTARTRALHLVHYLGFPQDATRWRRWCDDHGLLLIEDAAQAWLATVNGAPVGAVGQLAVFCLYKSVGIPDGAAAVGPALPALSPGAAGWGALDLAARHAAWFGARSAAAQALLTRLHPDRNGYDPVRDFALGDIGSRPSNYDAPLLARLTADDVAAQRRANYRELLDHLGDLVPPPFDPLPAGAAPFAFPVAAGDKHELLQRLRHRGIKALDFWSTPHPRLPVERFPAAAQLRRTVVCLPVHQELRSSDLQRIALAVTGRAPPTSRRPGTAGPPARRSR
jgi:selenocysteine lyase/cysteine desulfurase